MSPANFPRLAARMVLDLARQYSLDPSNPAITAARSVYDGEARLFAFLSPDRTAIELYIQFEGCERTLLRSTPTTDAIERAVDTLRPNGPRESDGALAAIAAIEMLIAGTAASPAKVYYGKGHRAIAAFVKNNAQIDIYSEHPGGERHFVTDTPVAEARTMLAALKEMAVGR